MAHSCAASCEEQHPKSFRLDYSLKATCGRRTCSDACKQSVCGNNETPSAACLPCLQEGLSGLCSHNDGFFQGGCLAGEDCSALVACILACPQ